MRTRSFKVGCLLLFQKVVYNGPRKREVVGGANSTYVPSIEAGLNPGLPVSNGGLCQMLLTRVSVRKMGRRYRVTGEYRTTAGKRTKMSLGTANDKQELVLLVEAARRSSEVSAGLAGSGGV